MWLQTTDYWSCECGTCGTSSGAPVKAATDDKNVAASTYEICSNRCMLSVLIRCSSGIAQKRPHH